MSETHIIDGEEFEGEEEEEEETPVATAVVDSKDKESTAETVTGDAPPKTTSNSSAAQPGESAAGEGENKGTGAKEKAEKTPVPRSVLEQERLARFREQRDRLFADVGRQWSSVYTQVNRELAAASGTGLAGALSVTQDAAKALRSARTDLEKLVAVL